MVLTLRVSHFLIGAFEDGSFFRIFGILTTAERIEKEGSRVPCWIIYGRVATVARCHDQSDESAFAVAVTWLRWRKIRDCGAAQSLWQWCSSSPRVRSNAGETHRKPGLVTRNGCPNSQLDFQRAANISSSAIGLDTQEALACFGRSMNHVA